jgi:hypothetical protein
MKNKLLVELVKKNKKEAKSNHKVFSYIDNNLFSFLFQG